MKRTLWALLWIGLCAGLASAQEAGQVQLTVSSDPPDASVFLYYPQRGPGGQDVFLGRTPADGAPLQLALTAGPAEVVVAKPGYVCKVEPLELSAGSARLEVRLTPDIEVPRSLVLKTSVPFVKDSAEGEEIYLTIVAQVVRLYVKEIDPRRLVDSSVSTLVAILNAVRNRERLLHRELPPWARRRYYGEELDLRGYPLLTFARAPPADDSSLRSFRLSAGGVGVEGQTDEADLDTYLDMLRQVTAFLRHQWDRQGVLSDSVVTRCLIEGLLAALGDEHTQFLDPTEVASMQEEAEGAFAGVGLEVGSRQGQLVVVQPIPDTPASRAGIQRGDRILAVDGTPTSGLTLEECVALMRGAVDSPVELTLRRGEQELTVTALRARIHVRSVAQRLLPGKVGYLRISSFMNEQLDQDVRLALAALMAQGAKSLVIDLRNNPGGLLSQARDVADLFVSKGVIVSTHTRLPGESRVLEARDRGARFQLPMVVLINGGSASAAEILAGTLSEHHLATLVGERSFGKGSVQRVLSLEPYGCALSLTVATYHLPSGRTPDGVGVEPDVKVSLSEEAQVALTLRSNYSVEEEPIDAQLQAAIDLLTRKTR